MCWVVVVIDWLIMVSVAGCLGYDVLGYLAPVACYATWFQLLVV